MTLARDKRSMCCTCPGHLSVRVGDSSRCCEEIVENLEIAPLNAIIIIIIIIIIVDMMMIHAEEKIVFVIGWSLNLSKNYCG